MFKLFFTEKFKHFWKMFLLSLNYLKGFDFFFLKYVFSYPAQSSHIDFINRRDKNFILVLFALKNTHFNFPIILNLHGPALSKSKV